MKSRLYLLRVLPTALAVGCSALCFAQTPAAVDARITGLTCEAELQKEGTASVVRLKGSAEIGRGLVAGNQIRCVTAGTLELLLPEGKKTFTSAQNWISIKPIPANPPYPKIADNLVNFGISGATRGIVATSKIIWPAENSTVMPGSFVIRWTPMPQKIHLSILSKDKDSTLWGPTEVDGGSGVLKSDAVSAILAGYKGKTENPGLVLTLTVGTQNDWEESHFSLLSVRQEQELNSDLDFWKTQTDGISEQLGRGYSFSRFKLFAEAADQYDAALKSAPQSRYLQQQAVQANRLAGRMDRVKILQSQMASPPEK